MIVRLGLGILFILGIGTALALYDRRVSSRFDYRFFSWKNFLIIAFGTCLAFIAVYNAPHIRAVGTNPLSLFFALSAGCVMCWTLIRNFRHTSVLHGFLGSALQIPTFSAIVLFFAPIGPAVLIVTVPLVVLPRIDIAIAKRKREAGNPKLL